MSSADTIAAEIADVKRRLAAFEKSSQLGHSSVEGSDRGFDFYDDDDEIRLSVGVQPDGSFTTAHFNAPAPPVPSAPILTSGVGTYTVEWDGKLLDDASFPSDWERAEIHVSKISGYTADDDNEVASFHSPKGGAVTIAGDPGVAYYVTLTSVNAAGVESAQTAEVAVVPSESGGLTPGSVTSEFLADGSVTLPALGFSALGGISGTLIPDPRFKDDAWRARRLAHPDTTEGWTHEKVSTVALPTNWTLGPAASAFDVSVDDSGSLVILVSLQDCGANDVILTSDRIPAPALSGSDHLSCTSQVLDSENQLDTAGITCLATGYDSGGNSLGTEYVVFGENIPADFLVNQPDLYEFDLTLVGDPQTVDPITEDYTVNDFYVWVGSRLLQPEQEVFRGAVQSSGVAELAIVDSVPVIYDQIYALGWTYEAVVGTPTVSMALTYRSAEGVIRTELATCDPPLVAGTGWGAIFSRRPVRVPLGAVSMDVSILVEGNEGDEIGVADVQFTSSGYNRYGIGTEFDLSGDTLLWGDKQARFYLEMKGFGQTAVLGSEDGGVHVTRSPEDEFAVEVFGDLSVNGGSVAPTGAVSMFAGPTAPAGWAFCDGSERDRTDALFGVIGDTFGVGDGFSSYNLPDLRNRFPVGVGTGGFAGFLSDDEGTADPTARTTKHKHDAGGYSTEFAGSHHHNAVGLSTGQANLSYSDDVTKSGSARRVYQSSHSHSVTGTTGDNGNHGHDVKGSSGNPSDGAEGVVPFLALNFIVKL